MKLVCRRFEDGFEREIRDPVHGMIPLTQMEIDLLDLPVMQRLKGIKQLAMAHLLYPGAQHTRFEHSLGTMHVAWRLASRADPLMENEQKTAVRLAALLHDIGHGPFSHVSDLALARRMGKSVHERLSRLILQHDRQVIGLLGSDLIAQVVHLLDVPVIDEERSHLHDIISGPVDADKLDYLLRDGLYTGVRYGTYDLEWIVSTASTVKRLELPDCLRLAFQPNAEPAVEQLAIARYHMSRQVYGHRVRCIADQMLVRAIETAVARGDEFLTPVYGRSEIDSDFLKAFLLLNDAELLRHLCNSRVSEIRELGERLQHRRLYKQVFDEIEWKDGGAEYGGLAESNTFKRQFKEGQTQAYEAAIAEALAVSPHEVILDFRASSSPGRLGPRERSDEQVLFSEDGRQWFSSGGVLSNQPSKPHPFDLREQVFVYAPADTKEKKGEMLAKKSEVKDAILEVIRSVSGRP